MIAIMVGAHISSKSNISFIPIPIIYTHNVTVHVKHFIQYKLLKMNCMNEKNKIYHYINKYTHPNGSVGIDLVINI